ncbi:MAG: GNAT family N-acetyltransferase [Phycisphaerales bacterium]|nr:GNAT family N-acetyltransferase [Phycisphaerales bacterium]
MTLRRLAMTDAAAIAAYRADPNVARYQSWETYSLAQAEELCRSQAAEVFGRPGSWFQLAIVRAGDDTLIGDCGLHFAADDPQQIEIGVTLSPSQQGRGLASEAVARILDLSFLTLNLHRVTARTDADNTKAAALFERLGFRREGLFRSCAMFKGVWCDELSFAMLEQEWRSNPSAGSAVINA